MDLVSEQAIETIQARLLARVLATFGMDPRLLLYDTTNFFTFISTTNAKADLAQRGHSKAQRHDLRQIGLALLVTRECQIPLLHHTYPGHVPDVALFPDVARRMIARYAKIAGVAAQPTLVFDQGNVSEDGMEELLGAGLHFVAALPWRTFPELFQTPRGRFEPVAGVPGTHAFVADVQQVQAAEIH